MAMRTIDTLAPKAPSKSTHRVGADTGFGGRMIIGLNAVLDAVSRGFERRRSRFALRELTDDQLKDIGLSRADAEREGLRKPWE